VFDSSLYLLVLSLWIVSLCSDDMEMNTLRITLHDFDSVVIFDIKFALFPAVIVWRSLDHNTFNTCCLCNSVELN
jgi:hypothetical protein